MASNDSSGNGVPVEEVIRSALESSAPKLDLSFRSLKELPQGLVILTSVEELDLRNNDLTSLGDEGPEQAAGPGSDAVSKGTAQEQQQQQHQQQQHQQQQLVKTPNRFWPSSLRVLRLSSNLLKRVGDPVLENLGRLEHLDVAGNGLKALPASLLACSSLVELSLSRNQLEGLPSEIGERLPLLRMLDVSYNSLHSLPESMGKLGQLERLNARFNQLDRVPASLGNATKLRQLDLGENFVNLTSVPGTLGNLTNLEELDLSNNHISTLPVQLGRVSGLQLLFLDGNPLTFPPPDVMGLDDPREEPLQKTVSNEERAREQCRKKTRLVKAFLAAKYREWDEENSKSGGTWESWLGRWTLLEWLGSFFGYSTQQAGLLEGASFSVAPRAALPQPPETLEPELPQSTGITIAENVQRSRVEVQGPGAASRPSPETEALVAAAPSVPQHLPRPLAAQTLLQKEREEEACLA